MLRSADNNIYAKDDLSPHRKSNFFLSFKKNHNSYFNNKRKIAYETYLSQLFFTHITPSFMRVIKKISDLIIPDIEKIYREHDKENIISTKMHNHLSAMHDLQILFKSSSISIELFYTDILKALNSTDPKDFYKQMSIHRAYLKYFWETGPNAKAEMQEMLDQQWTTLLDLQRLFADARRFRNDAICYKNHKRLDNPGRAICQNFGLFAPEEYDQLSHADQSKFVGKLPPHISGMLHHNMTLSGSFSATAMLDYDLPVICGPSGATAMRLALGIQANLTNNEMSLLQFAIAMYHVAISAHSVDECFVIANDSSFNHYIRGEYRSIIPNDIKTVDEYYALWISIKDLNKKYEDILRAPVLISPILKLREEKKQNNEMVKNLSSNKTNLFALDLAYPSHRRHSKIDQKSSTVVKKSN